MILSTYLMQSVNRYFAFAGGFRRECKITVKTHLSHQKRSWKLGDVIGTLLAFKSISV